MYYYLTVQTPSVFLFTALSRSFVAFKSHPNDLMCIQFDYCNYTDYCFQLDTYNLFLS